MKFLITLLLILSTLTIQAQNIFDTKSSQEKREQDILNLRKSDADLYSHNRSGKRNLDIGKVLGCSSLVFMTTGAVSIYQSSQTSGPIAFGRAILGLFSFALSAVIGTVGLIFHTKGREKVREISIRSDKEMNRNNGIEFALQSTTNGVGIVLSF